MKMRISFHRIAVVWAMTAGNKKQPDCESG